MARIKQDRALPVRMVAAIAVVVYGIYAAMGNNIGSLASGVDSALTKRVKAGLVWLVPLVFGPAFAPVSGNLRPRQRRDREQREK